MAFLSLGLACTTSLPGAIDVGLFEFSATPLKEECAFDVEGSFQFKGRFRLESNLVDGYFVYRDVNRAAQFDGQNMVSVYVAERIYKCGDCDKNVVETLNVALLSKTQNESLHGQCPRNALSEDTLVEGGQNISPSELRACGAALSEGIPVADGESIFPPGPVSGGFDAVRACGTLVVMTTPLPEEDCLGDCDEEEVVYYIEGIRKE
ncbi:MAG: hypothetical protein FWG75_04510 [Cystobacterineae bacterium]|nr:hypothetical protein [Cystobacterineae bacterium]